MNAWEGIDEAVMVAQVGSFVGAAERLNTAPSNISRAIDRLEKRLHTRIFTRSTRVVKLTDSGRALITQFARLVSERDEAIAAIEIGSAPRGNLRLTCSVAIGERFIGPIMRRLCIEHPDLSIELDLTNRVVDILSEGYDLAIRTGQLPDSGLICTQIAQRRILTCASPRYLERHGVPKTIADLAQHQCLVGTSDQWQFRQAGTLVPWPVKGRWRCNNGNAIVQAVLDDMGICHLPEFYVSDHVRSGAISVILQDFCLKDEPVWAIYPSKRHLSSKIQIAIETLRKELPAFI